MKRIFKSLLCALTSMTALSFAAHAGAESIAIVAGIGDYTNLPGAHLPGIENDVDVMERVLQKAGFRVVRLFNRQATEEGIRNAFAAARGQVRSQDRFVYYQSSHGSSDFRLLTYDTETSGAHSLTRSDIQGLMASIPTNRKSLILDACFSGGFKGFRLRGDEIIKYYGLKANVRHTSGVGNDQPAGYRDRNDRVQYTSSASAATVPTGAAHAVFASSQENEPSLILRVDGQIGSVFTHMLAAELAGGQSRPWNAAVQPTINRVQEATSGKQTPIFDNRYLPALIYTTVDVPNRGASSVSTNISDFAQYFNITGSIAGGVRLTADLQPEPNADGAYRPDTNVELTISTQYAGYLFLINRDDQDMAQMVGWAGSELDFSSPEQILNQCRLASPGVIRLSDNGLKINTTARAGMERWKAFLITDRENALSFARLWLELARDKSRAVRRDDFKFAKLNDIRYNHGASVPLTAIYTSEQSYKVTDR